MTAPGNIVMTIASAIATIPHEQWRGFLTDKVVRETVNIYLRGHYPKRACDISTTGEGIFVRLAAARSPLDLLVSINGGVAAAATHAGDPHTSATDSVGRQQQRLVEELNKMLSFIADQPEHT